MGTKSICCMLFLFSLFALISAGDMETELFHMANKQYESGNYDSASVLYRKIIDAGFHDARVYYNLGNVSFRQKKLGEAILCYEKAHWLDERDADIIANLEYTKSLTKDKIVPVEHSMFFKVLLKLHNLSSLPVKAALIVVLLFSVAGLFTAYLSFDAAKRSLISILMTIAIIMLILLVPSYMVKRSERENGENGIVTAGQVNIFNEPNGSEVLFTVHEGAKFRIIRKVDSFAFASLENGLAGWVNLNDIGIIEIRN